MEERKLCPLRYYADCVSTTLTVLILHDVESVYFFYSNPVYIYIIVPLLRRREANVISPTTVSFQDVIRSAQNKRRMSHAACRMPHALRLKFPSYCYENPTVMHHCPSASDSTVNKPGFRIYIIFAVQSSFLLSN